MSLKILVQLLIFIIFKSVQGKFFDSDILLERNKNENHSFSFNVEEKWEIQNILNTYRGNVYPPAANMRYLEWNNTLESLAQKWSQKCLFRKGIDQRFEDFRQPSQSMFMGHEDYKFAFQLWLEEEKYYNFHANECQFYNRCHNYTSMVYSKSTSFGCGRSHCSGKTYIVCYYHPPYIEGEELYKVGKSCSLCELHSTSYNGLCYMNICVTEAICNSYGFNCSCSLKCHNCGQLNEEKCTCICKNGWDMLDCSVPCMDESPKCGKPSGFPDELFCSMDEGRVKSTYCRRMCQECQTNSNPSCCEGNICNFGFVLDIKSCRCELLCPGPKCDSSTDCKKKRCYSELVPRLIGNKCVCEDNCSDCATAKTSSSKQLCRTESIIAFILLSSFIDFIKKL
ncbi:C-type lectin domain family 18 member B-like, partial [Centruroides sculpturatus]|uniref:C-type lectin domain family 18 member B-like n=1 Tax=Centruroides sculpturatus TaxID=218467 RepID=UPI000C6EBFD1